MIRRVIGASALLLLMGIAAGCGQAAPVSKGLAVRSASAAAAADRSPVIVAKMPHAAKTRPGAAETRPGRRRPVDSALDYDRARDYNASWWPGHGELPESRVDQRVRLRQLERGGGLGQAPGFAAGLRSTSNLLGVNQDPWSGGQGPQVLTASSVQDWSVTATDTDPADAPGEVLTYPDASFNYYQLATQASGYTVPPGAVRLEQHHVADQRLQRVHAAAQ